MIKYDVNYYYNLLKIQAGTAEKICKIRWQFIYDNVEEGDVLINVLDYGCGVGFMKAFKSEHTGGWRIDTFDIMPVPQTGIRHDKYSIIMLYDVLEHIPDFTEITSILEKTKYVAVTVPIKPDNMKWKDYKHFKPGEHLHYFTHDLLEHIFETMGFRLIIKGTPECPPREHVWSFLFKRKE